MAEYNEQDEEEYDDDYYSPTSWDRDQDESDEDYDERTQDLEDYLEYYS
ncbi:MAG: hypothetical protein Q4A15_04150 [Prevotellaceae bacterium]|nr:hypothetical protein [Prevotellaceae bacterium]